MEEIITGGLPMAPARSTVRTSRQATQTVQHESTQSLLRPIRRRHTRYQCFGRGRHSNRACAPSTGWQSPRGTKRNCRRTEGGVIDTSRESRRAIEDF